jgi:hypothetical protein
VLESLGLKVQVPMILQVDNKGVMDLANNWSVGVRTRHMNVRTFFLRELKEQGLLIVEWIPTEANSPDLFTKNLQGPLFAKHASVYVSNSLSMDPQREVWDLSEFQNIVTHSLSGFFHSFQTFYRICNSLHTNGSIALFHLSYAPRCIYRFKGLSNTWSLIKNTPTVWIAQCPVYRRLAYTIIMISWLTIPVYWLFRVPLR